MATDLLPPILEIEIVIVRLRAKLDLADRDLLLVLAGGLLLLSLLVLVLGVVEHAAHRRTRLRSHLDEVQFAVLRELEGVGDLQHAHLLPRVVDEAHLGHANSLVDPGGVPLGRAPVEPAGDRH